MIWNIMQYIAFKFQAYGLLNFPFSITRPPMCRSLKERPWQKCLQFSMFRHSLSAYLLPRTSIFSLQDSSPLLIYFTGGLPLTPSPLILPSYSFLTANLIHSHQKPKLCRNTKFHPFKHSTIHFFCYYTFTKPLIQTFVMNAILSQHTTCTSDITHFHFISYSYLLCNIPNSCL